MCPHSTRPQNAAHPEPVNFKSSLRLPESALPMRAESASREPELLALWGADNGYAALRAARQGRSAFTLHDGPPYANGHLHMGHALNKVLKDMVTRSQRMAGKDASFRPGWDCHGLPVEWKVEEEYRARGLEKHQVPVLEFRQACRDYAAHWVKVQSEEFRRLGVAADWSDPYLTMSSRNEAAVAREFLDMVQKGYVYRGEKPMTWSPVEQTVLAEAELEYRDRKSPAAWLAYKVLSGPHEGADLVAWTTTPWTVPAGVALAYSPELSYGLYRVERQTDTAWAAPGQRLVLCDARAEATAEALRVTLTREADVSSSDLDHVALAHPLSMRGSPWQDALPCLAAAHVSDDAGTGFVHTAPAHGLDDYRLGLAARLPMPSALDETGSLKPDFPLFGGLEVVRADGTDGPANEAVLWCLRECGTLLGRRLVTHSYPHSWRSKAPVLFRSTPQWFASVSEPTEGWNASLRARALSACADVTWLPQSGRQRMEAMLKDRPDWVLSRQRAWGVPLPLFTRRDLPSSHPDFLLRDAAVNARVLAAFEKEGGDAWYRADARQRFLAPDHDPDLFDQCQDVLDVWFDSGASHSYALADGERADLYLEGTDQHRGWFQHALLHSVATRGCAPFKAVMTHGFTLDDKGRKMSKSLGNTVTPEEVVARYGADVLRLWVAMCDSSGDLRLGEKSLKGAQETYRKLRNTLRFLLGVLGDGNEVAPRPEGELPLLERWLLDRLHHTGEATRAAYLAMDFPRAVQTVLSFCTSDLSARYLELRKDVFYCEAEQSSRRAAALYTASVCLSALTGWLAPVLVFAAEQAFMLRTGSSGVHGTSFAPLARLADPDAAARLAPALDLRTSLLPLLEEARKGAGPTRSERMVLTLPRAMLGSVEAETLRELLLVAEVQALGDGRPAVSETHWCECPRCRRSRPEVAQLALCTRCRDAL